MELSTPQLIQIRNNYVRRMQARWFSIREVARRDELKIKAIDEQILKLNAEAELDSAMRLYEERLMTI